MSRRENLTSLDLNAELKVSQRFLPHWYQPGAATFVTFRTLDSMRAAALERWRQQQLTFLRSKSVSHPSLPSTVRQLNEPLRTAFKRFRNSSFHKLLDKGYGDCQLRHLPVAQLIAERLLFFDHERYDLDRFVIMPNHVHILAGFRKHYDMRKECENWLHNTALSINSLLKRNGAFWQAEPFDHCIRSETQFQWVRAYIANNPHAARLRRGTSPYWQKD